MPCGECLLFRYGRNPQLLDSSGSATELFRVAMTVPPADASSAPFHSYNISAEAISVSALEQDPLLQFQNSNVNVAAGATAGGGGAVAGDYCCWWWQE